MLIFQKGNFADSKVENLNITSEARVLLGTFNIFNCIIFLFNFNFIVTVGIGADEQMGGYGRHRTAYRKRDWQGLAGLFINL